MVERRFCMTEEDESSKRSGYALDRVLAISDGVFAFAVTLLVLDLAVPVLSSGASSADLWQALSEEWVSFLSYLLSFFIAGVWWNAHNRNFRYIRDVDSTLRWLNLVFLLWIALLPFFTKILDQYNTLQIAVVLYATDQTFAGIFMGLSWWYASRNHRLVDKNLKESVIRSRLLSNALAPFFFIISIGISFVSPVIATYSWCAMLPVFILTHRLHRERARVRVS
jgi:uncharacterized membrane protein